MDIKLQFNRIQTCKLLSSLCRVSCKGSWTKLIWRLRKPSWLSKKLSKLCRCSNSTPNWTTTTWWLLLSCSNMLLKDPLWITKHCHSTVTPNFRVRTSLKMKLLDFWKVLVICLSSKNNNSLWRTGFSRTTASQVLFISIKKPHRKLSSLINWLVC